VPAKVVQYLCLHEHSILLTPRHVPLARKRQQSERPARSYEGVGEAHRMTKMDVLIEHSVDDQKLSIE
jgi:hypothetical protein